MWALVEKQLRKMEKRKGYRDPVKRANETKHEFVKRGTKMAWDRLKRCAQSVPRKKCVAACLELKERARKVIKGQGDALSQF